jgi:SAM-dependent MidA family methyltransferase
MIHPRSVHPSLADRLRTRIRAHGPIGFAAFMEAALYDPEEGFFQRNSVGERGHFVTAPHLSPAFGVMVARQLEEIWELLGRPEPFVVVEAGAGDGTLARQVLEFLSNPPGRVLRYLAVERGAAGRAAMRGLEVAVHETLDEIPEGPAGCVIANELLDNLPFRWLRRTEDGVVEMHVGVEGDGFQLVPRPADDPDLAPWARGLPVGGERLVQEEAVSFVTRAAELFDRSYLWIADYGFTDGERPEAPHAYRGHRLEADVLAEPGTRDITAGVDFEAVAVRAREAGLAVWGPVRQRDALLALGARGLDQDARSRQVRARSEGRGLEATRIYSARQRASLLIQPSGLGDGLVLAAGRGVDVPLRSVRQVG